MGKKKTNNKDKAKKETPQQKLTQTETKKSYTRMQSFGDAFHSLNKGGFTKGQLIQMADEKYTQQGGKSNPKESAWICNYGLKALEAVGLEVNIKNG